MMAIPSDPLLPPSLLPAAVPSSSQTPLLPPGLVPATPMQVTQQVPSIASQAPFLEAIDVRPDPRFATHLRPVFTEVIAMQQEKLLQQTKLDAERKEKAQKARQRIIIYPWTDENTPPIIKFFQDFSWPYLVINSDLLSTVGLLEASEQGRLRIYDEKEIHDWVAVNAGYVMEVQEGQRLFLKDASLLKCADFIKLLETRPQGPASHLHYHLPHQRSYVREMHKRHSPFPCLSESPPLLTFNSSQPTPSPPPATSPLPLPPPLLSHSLAPRASGSGTANDPMEIDEEVSEAKHWPTDYYTSDIGNCMHECSSRTQRVHQRSETHRAVFAKHFPNVGFIPSTFSNQRELWIKASGSLREEFIELGHCREGLWSVFAKRARQEKKVAKASVVEMD